MTKTAKPVPNLPGWKSRADILLALVILVVLLLLEYAFRVDIHPRVLLGISLVAYLLAGRNVLLLGFRKSIRGDFFNEFVLMSVATIGAFVIGEYEEGVAVMVFYQIGEWFQHDAVHRAKESIKSLLDVRAEEAFVFRNGEFISVHPSEVETGETIRIKPGEKVPLDGKLLSNFASFNTAALTGESKPDSKSKGEDVYAGMINQNTPAELNVTAHYRDSKLSRILEMVQDATGRKSKTQLFISRFAKVYTPIVFFLAFTLCVFPVFIVDDYEFREWFYRSLVFLVISCPCALVVSIPLGYFGGIGLASRNGILFKGGNFLDLMTEVKTVVLDKTGTLTRGVFKVSKVVPLTISNDELVKLAVSLEENSSHPVAKAILEYAKDAGAYKPDSVEELPGHGLIGWINGKQVMAGNEKLLRKFNIQVSPEIAGEVKTMVLIACGGELAGYFVISDEVKAESAEAVRRLHEQSIKVMMFSGDKQSIVDDVAAEIGVDHAQGNLLPEGKVEELKKLLGKKGKIAFVGDGLNDAPVIALSDVGIAMGGLGSDVAIETADVVIQNDNPLLVSSAIKAGKITRNIVWQNIVLAMGVKIFVLILGAGGIASLWEAVIADVGVALLAILNAVRIQRMKL